MIRSFFRTRTGRFLVFALLTIVLAAGGYALYSAYQLKQMTRQWYHPLADAPRPSLADSAKEAAQPPVLHPEMFAKPKPLPPFTLLLIGIDSRDGERARSDTMILAAVHPDRQRAYLLSIPRDSYIELPGRGYDKLNHAMAFGGPALLKRSLESFLDVRIDRYMTIDFDGFRKIVDELGGVRIHVKKRMKYTDPTDNTAIDLYPGWQNLNGKQALDYSRYRKSDLGREDSDYDRIARQQEILKALANKGESVQAFFKAFKLMDILGQHVKTDLGEDEIASLLATYYDPKDNQLVTDTLNGTDERIWHNGIRGWYYLVPKAERDRVRARLKQELAH